MNALSKIRCAIYTRKSSEEGLEQDFNSLDAQHEACAAYIASQKHEGWVLIPTCYDDGGISGGTLERPGLQRLLEEIDAGRVDRVVVYKVDRLCRSLTDFSKLVGRFDAAECSFVSVTQSFTTATSMGRLTLNMLLSFAQFEREVTAERIRDKIAASKKKGMWMGGLTPLGYDAAGRTLVINAEEAETVRTIFALYDRFGSVREVRAEADRLKLVTKRRRFPCGKITGGVPFSRGRIYHLLSNPVYIGRIRHGDHDYPGQHDPIIDQDIWDRVHAMLTDHAGRAKRRKTAAAPSPLAGKFIDEIGDVLTPSHANRNGRRYRYYVSRRLIARSGEEALDGWRLPAATLERAVADLIKGWLADPATPSRLIHQIEATEIGASKSTLDRLADELDGNSMGDLLQDLVSRGKIASSSLTIELAASSLAHHLGIAQNRIARDALTLATGFTLRRRGVEARLILDAAPPRVDRTLLRNVAQGHAWFHEIQRGTSIKEIAAREGTTRQRVSAIVELAFLAPDLVRQIVEGRQPIPLTSDRLIKAGVPILWADQRTILADT